MIAIRLEKRLKAIRHVGVEAANMRALELDHVHVDKCDIAPILVDALAGGPRKLFEIVRKRTLGQRLVEGQIRLGERLPVLLEERSWEHYLRFVKRMPYFNGWWDPAIEGYFRADIRENADGTVRARSRPEHIRAVINGFKTG